MIPSLLPSELHHIRKTFLWSFTPHLCLQCRVGTVWQCGACCLLLMVWWWWWRSQYSVHCQPSVSRSPSVVMVTVWPTVLAPHLLLSLGLTLASHLASASQGRRRSRPHTSSGRPVWGGHWLAGSWTVQVRPPWGLPWHWNVNSQHSLHHYMALTWSC